MPDPYKVTMIHTSLPKKGSMICFIARILYPCQEVQRLHNICVKCFVVRVTCFAHVCYYCFKLRCVSDKGTFSVANIFSILFSCLGLITTFKLPYFGCIHQIYIMLTHFTFLTLCYIFYSSSSSDEGLHICPSA